MGLESRSRLAALAVSLVLTACAAAEVGQGKDVGDNGGGGAGASGKHDAGGSYDPGFRGDASVTPISARCGDGERTPDEACDDGNQHAGDGCTANCLGVEPGYSCVPAGKPCRRVARCGDGVVVPPELCDDGNVVAGDGCSATCKVELGWKCDGSPSTCGKTSCGDGKIEGAESCDDHNVVAFDGCSAACQTEPDCKGGACASGCGDGIVLGEDCDDGNALDGDGCSATCKIEPGYDCKQPAIGDRMLVPIVYRDFRAHQPADFQPNAIGRTAALPGMVMKDLDADGKPVFTGIGDAYTTKETFAQWYRDVPALNHTTPSQLALYSTGTGSFVNRWGPNGEQWVRTEIANFCGNVGQEVGGMPCTATYETDCTRMLAMGKTMVRCYTEGSQYKATFLVDKVDGTPLFFPVDADTFTPQSERAVAQIPPPIYDASGTWPPEEGMPLHNFHFTSEVRYWFRYDATKTYALDFVGDDDVWVFLNRKLAVDLGGIHTPVQGAITLDAQNAASFGLVDGKVYEIAVFQAERNVSGSSYKLTLSGFNLAPTECRPVCGDGIIGIGEECDDGANTGGYGKCGPGCKLDGFCGDGVLQKDFEDCDDGVENGDECPSGCRILTVL